MAKMTERQAKAWPDAVAEVRRYGAEAPDNLARWTHVVWEDEVRPGRGHMLDATNVDGEYVVQIRMDVYGYPNVSVGQVDWLHNSSDEECDCAHCVFEREGES